MIKNESGFKRRGNDYRTNWEPSTKQHPGADNWHEFVCKEQDELLAYGSDLSPIIQGTEDVMKSLTCLSPGDRSATILWTVSLRSIVTRAESLSKKDSTCSQSFTTDK
jgi:hypothetical protein